jgi:outer membrane protein assembly factor BamB
MKNAKPTRAVMLSCLLLLGANLALAQDWPQWRGANRDNKVSGFNEPKTWPKALTQKWRVTVGLGESSPVMVGEKIYVFARQGDDEVTLCLDAASGQEIWKNKYAAAAVKGAASGHPGTRSTPAVGEGKLCTLGVAGVVSCLDAATGNLLWRKDTNSKPQFYTATSPIIVDGMCIVYVGSDKKGSLTAYDLANNGQEKVLWTGAGAPYGSPVVMTVGGTKMLVTPATGMLAGINLADGKVLWQIKIPGDYQSNQGTPIIDGQTVIYSMAAKGKDGGTMALKIEKKGDAFDATQLWRKELAAHKYNTPVLKDGLLYGFTGPSTIGASTTLFCMDAKNGDKLWLDDTKRGECGNILDAGKVLVALSSDANLIFFEPSGKTFKEVASYKVADKGGAAGPWSCPIISGNRIFVKDKGGALTLWTID